MTLALWQWHIYHYCLFIYLFIIERCTEGKLVTQWAKNLIHWVTSFCHWMTFMSPSRSVKRCSGRYQTYFSAWQCNDSSFLSPNMPIPNYKGNLQWWHKIHGVEKIVIFH